MQVRRCKSERLVGFCTLILVGTLYAIHLLCSKGAGKGLDHRSYRTLSRNSNDDVKLFLITPTYTRYTQQADLVRLSNTLMHVSNLHWIIVEDSEVRTKLVEKVVKESNIMYTHLNIRTRKDLVLKNEDPHWKKHRGVDQRNLALKWLRHNTNLGKGVVYFADDDNTYHLDLFKEMRTTKGVSMWPVALVGGLRWEGPICRNGKVEKFFTGWKPSRKFPMDMAGFAFHMDLLLRYQDAIIDPESRLGFLETDFLKKLHITLDDVEAKADDCTRILVWHTQTVVPKMKEEAHLIQSQGYGSNPDIII